MANRLTLKYHSVSALLILDEYPVLETLTLIFDGNSRVFDIKYIRHFKCSKTIKTLHLICERSKRTYSHYKNSVAKMTLSDAMPELTSLFMVDFPLLEKFTIGKDSKLEMLSYIASDKIKSKQQQGNTLVLEVQSQDCTNIFLSSAKRNDVNIDLVLAHDLENLLVTTTGLRISSERDRVRINTATLSCTEIDLQCKLTLDTIRINAGTKAPEMFLKVASEHLVIYQVKK
jgi:hypothetical protein